MLDARNASRGPLNRKLMLQILAVAAGTALLVYAANRASRPRPDVPAPATHFDVVVVGSGIAGMTAAYELANGGANVHIVDMASVFGGHAVMATGDMAFADTPFQRSQGITTDSPDLLYKDIMEWGEDPDPTWARLYADRSRAEVHDWLVSLGITFEKLVNPAGNSVMRTHRTKGRGIGLVTPIYTECARRPNISFRWNTRLDRLLIENGHVVGIAATNVRTGAPVELRAPVVILATGGFQSNLDMVRAAWAKDIPFPDRLLVGSGINALGLGHQAARAAGASLTRLDHQWNYITGIPDPRFADGKKGVHAYNEWSIWVNADGKRFLAERTSAKFGLPILMRQRTASYWSIFDEATKRKFFVAGSDWASFDTVDELIFQNPALTSKAGTLEELATKAGLPPAALRQTVAHFNAMVDKGVDEEFQHFGPGKEFKPQRIEHPPYYAARFYPMTRKSEGGVAIDRTGRVLDAQGRFIPGLYAVGELTGFAGVNGRYPLEGTFMAPSMLTARIAGRAALAELASTKAAPALLPVAPPPPAAEKTAPACLACHQLPSLVTKARPGYWHFERVHTVVLARQYDCSRCHAELSTLYDARTHHIDRLTQPRVCTNCHSGEDVPTAAR
jgi:predicted oxidoreductase